MIAAAFPVYIAIIYGLPLSLAVFPILRSHSDVERMFWIFLAPVVFCLAFVFTAGILSVPAQKAIVAGKFPRKLSHPVYGGRRLFGLCWTAVFYCTPIYFAILQVAPIKKLVFRLFGYRGSPEFTTYPDTWIRDLPLLKLGRGAYLANKATIGTNLCLKNGGIFVDSVQIGEDTLVGHLAVVGPGASLGKKSEMGVTSIIGVRARLGENSRVQPVASINHGVEIGKNCEIGTAAFIGTKAVILDGIKIPPGCNVPSGTILRSQDDVKKLFSSETMHLNSIRQEMVERFRGAGPSHETSAAVVALHEKTEVTA